MFEGAQIKVSDGQISTELDDGVAHRRRTNTKESRSSLSCSSAQDARGSGAM